eukprot:2060271-Pyramimonas_sp.AAC.1
MASGPWGPWGPSSRLRVALDSLDAARKTVRLSGPPEGSGRGAALAAAAAAPPPAPRRRRPPSGSEG